MRQYQLLREQYSRADRATHTQPRENFRSASPSRQHAGSRGARNAPLDCPATDLELHAWLGVTRRDWQDLALLAAIGFAVVGLMVLGAI